ncbi:hypothetical protein ACJIZ3_023870 [Penstemon smallii]|uniref:Uncharacterized protein n=1 Tax=Penstemon smallii TaxID=265156 RepID=A0ABD3TQ81_9LAMI
MVSFSSLKGAEDVDFLPKLRLLDRLLWPFKFV